MPIDRTLLKTRRRLEREELKHLRIHCAELAERLEVVERERDAAVSDAESAWQMACVHQNAYHEILELARGEVSAPPVIGITREGELGIVKEDA